MFQQKNPCNLTSNRLFTQDAASYTIFVSLLSRINIYLDTQTLHSINSNLLLMHHYIKPYLYIFVCINTFNKLKFIIDALLHQYIFLV